MKASPPGFEPHPAVGAFILSAAAVMIGFNAWFSPDSSGESSVLLEMRWWKTAAGLILWVIGSAFVARARYATWSSGVAHGLLFLPGLLLLLWRTRHKMRRRFWAGVDLEIPEKELRRRYRPMKALY